MAVWCPQSRGTLRDERIVFWWPNTNKSIIWILKNGRIQKKNIFWLPKKREKYENEYYLASKKWPNMNTNINRFAKKDQIRIQNFRTHLLSSERRNIYIKYRCYSILFMVYDMQGGCFSRSMLKIQTKKWEFHFITCLGNVLKSMQYAS